MTQTNTKHSTIIQPNRNWFYIDWRGILQYQDLLFLFVKRDFVSRFKQTILGPFWFIIQPVLMTMVFTVVFNKVAKISTDETPPTLFYLCSLVVWRYFSDCLNKTSTSLVANAGIYGKVYFPRLIVPLSILISNLFSFSIQLTTFLCFFSYFKLFTIASTSINPNMYIFLLPFFLLQTAAISLGVGLWLSALTAKYRDFSFLLGFLTQLWMYATPIIYPMSLVPDKWKFAVALNPVAPIVEVFRYAFLGKGEIHFQYLSTSIIVTAVVLFSGILFFNKVERTFIDTV